MAMQRNHFDVAEWRTRGVHGQLPCQHGVFVAILVPRSWQAVAVAPKNPDALTSHFPIAPHIYGVILTNGQQLSGGLN